LSAVVVSERPGTIRHSCTQNIYKPVTNKIKTFLKFKLQVFQCYLPGFAKIVRPLDQHGRRPERLERDDQMREMELGLEIEFDRDVLDAVLRLPPRGSVGRAPLALPLRLAVPVDDVVDAVAHQRVLRLRIAVEAFLFVLQMRNYAKFLLRKKISN
jgi:hypothetical protein